MVGWRRRGAPDIASAWCAGALAFGFTALAACGPAPLSNATRYTPPPPPLALVAIVAPSQDQMAGEPHQLADVIRSGATPGEAVVAMWLQPSFDQAYAVRAGDSLASIAAVHGLTLPALEAGSSSRRLSTP